MQKPNIKRLYKYAPFNTRTIASLVTETIWYASPSTFNDPFDCRITSNSQEVLASIEEKTKQLEALLKKSAKNKSEDKDIESILARIHAMALTPTIAREGDMARMFLDFEANLQESIHNIGVLSLSECKNNILMWSHYAANHRGVCLEFERNANNKLGTDAVPITYSQSRAFEASSKDFSKNLFFAKHTGWRYEKEWRVLENKGGIAYPFPGPLISVICGAQMEDRDIETLIGIIGALNSRREAKIYVHFAQMNPKIYSLAIKKTRPNKYSKNAKIEF